MLMFGIESSVSVQISYPFAEIFKDSIKVLEPVLKILYIITSFPFASKLLGL